MSVNYSNTTHDPHLTTIIVCCHMLANFKGQENKQLLKMYTDEAMKAAKYVVIGCTYHVYTHTLLLTFLTCAGI